MANFNSKETYLAARAEWKANYKHLTGEIRKARQAYKEASSAFSKIKYDYSRGGNNIAWSGAYSKLENARDVRETLRRHASDAIYELREMKKEAAKQWLASHGQPA